MATDQNNDPKKELNTIFDDERDLLMDHEYDGIQELDNRMPPWWLYGFYFTIAFSVVYLFYYDVTGWGLTQEEEYEREMAMAAERFNLEEREAIDFAELAILEDESSLEAGRMIYVSQNNLCATCHGQQGQGLVGPDLTNNLWKHGCDLESIMVAIKDGFPTRGMQPYGSNARLTTEELHQLASYIISLRGTEPPNPRAPDMSRSVECHLD